MSNETLVTAEWVAEHAGDPQVAVFEINQSIETAHKKGHVPGALGRDWKPFLWDELKREFPSPEDFAQRLGAAGIGDDTKVVFYGDPLQYGTYAWWTLQYSGHTESAVLDGALNGWRLSGRAATRDITPAPAPVTYRSRKRNETIRARREDVFKALGDPGTFILDVRSPDEYAGKSVGPPGTDHGAERHGRIPGAKHRHFETLLTADGKFKPAAEIKGLLEDSGVTWDRNIILYCRLSHRASLVYFAITQIIGYSNVRLYDGSWTEWGSLVGAPIEK